MPSLQQKAVMLSPVSFCLLIRSRIFDSFIIFYVLTEKYSAPTIEKRCTTPDAYDQYITDLAIHGFEKSEELGLNFKEVLADFEKRFKDKNGFQKYADSLLVHHQDDCYAIFSCCKRWDSIPMWAHYANEHKGFCIGFWTKKLIDSDVFGKLGEVVYQTAYPEIKPRVAKKDEQLIINSFIETHTKGSAWKNEKEYRFMSNHFPQELTTEERRVRMEDDVFAEVILGINISSDDKQGIVNLCNLKKIPVFQAEKEDFKFKIKRVLV